MSKLISKIVVPDSNEATGYSLYNVKDSGAIHSSDVGVAGGVASLDNAGKVPSSQLPSYVDDVIEGYYHENKFYTTYTPGQEEEDPGTYSGEITAETGKIYVDIQTNQSYRWSGSAYIVISSPYVLPIASANTLGGVKVGDNLSIDQNGVLSAQASSGAKTNEENGNGIGTCSTSSGTALTVSLTGYELVQNGFVAVTFEHNVPANATLNINSKGAKPIIYKGSAITADIIKADDTVMFCYNGSQYVVTSLGAGAAPVNPNETVNISLTQVFGNSADLIGANITITNDDSGDILYTGTWVGTSLTTEIGINTNYTISVDTIAGYAVTPSQSYFALYQYKRNVNFNYVAQGVYIESTDHQLYTSSDWSSNKTANAIVVITSDVQLRLAVNSQQQKYQLAPQQYSDMTTYCDAVGGTSTDITYDGKTRTTQINNWLAAHGITSGNYASIYCSNYVFPDNVTKGHLPSYGELITLYNNKTQIDNCLTACSGIAMVHDTTKYAAGYISSNLSTIWSGCYFRHSWLYDIEGNNMHHVNEAANVRPVAYYTL